MAVVVFLIRISAYHSKIRKFKSARIKGQAQWLVNEGEVTPHVGE